MKTIAVVVTYNRFELLKRTIACLRASARLDGIVVVNNDSPDGTREWLDKQTDLTVIHQANVGGAGGFATGMKMAREMEADWIWCMDDDVFPRPDCLDNLLSMTSWPGVGIMSPRRLIDGEVFTTEFRNYDFDHTWASTSTGSLRGETVDKPVEIAGAAFEGLFIKREVVDTIGYPDSRLFIFYDDTDYCLRAFKAGFKLLYVPDALMDKQRFFSNAGWVERTKAKRWKRFYQVRNCAWFQHTYGNTKGVRYLRAFNMMLGYMLPALLVSPFSKAYRIGDARRFWRAYRDGLKGKLGKISYL